MTISRRDFMKFVGISVSSLMLTRCRLPLPVTCYAPLPPDMTPTESSNPRARLRKYWLSFGELAERTNEASAQGSSDDAYMNQLLAGHRAELDRLVAAGDLTQPVSELIQEAYAAAVYHVWRSNTNMTCYEPMMIDYAPTSAQILVQQAAALDKLVAQGTIDPQTLENARAALEHDLAFQALSQAEVDKLYASITEEWIAQAQNQGRPAFEDLDLEISPDCKAAAQFIIELLIAK
jgi:hypothetical protein